jgi:hypothetical protein
MSPKALPDASPTRAADIVRSLDGVSGEVDVEGELLNHGDDILDVVIGWREIVKNRWLFGCMSLPRGAWCGDAIAVGSGPSLDAALPQLRELQDTVLLVAAHSALPKLLKNDIVPHVITPKERDPSCGLVPLDLPYSVIYGGLTVVPEAPLRCGKHWLIENSDHFMRWLGHGGSIHQPLTSGTLAAGVAAAVAGNAYLVGHDLSSGHYAGYNFVEETPGGTIDCVDGVERQSCLLYRRCRDELSSIAHDAVVVQCCPTGGTINGLLALAGNVPKRGHKKVWLPTSTAWARRNSQAVLDVEAQIQRIPAIMAEVERRAREARKPDDITAIALGGPDSLLVAALFQTVYLSTSILRRTLKLSDSECLETMRDAILNASNCLRGVWREMADDCA